MQAAALLGAGVVLFATVTIGLIAHELAHALVLRTLGVPSDIRWFPGRQASVLAGGLTGTWASVTPRQIPEHVPTWGIQLSATAPLALATPLLPLVFGLVQPPLGGGSPYAAALLVGWLACSIPSPQDFSVFWHADRVVKPHRDSSAPPGE